MIGTEVAYTLSNNSNNFKTNIIMAKIYDTIMSLIKPGRIVTAAAALGETEQKISAGVDTILPSLLARALKKGDTPEIREIAAEAGKLKVHEKLNQIWEGDGIIDGKNIGVRLENQLIGVENPRFYEAVAKHTGLKNEHANRLTNWIAGTIAAWFGEKVAAGKSYASLLEELAGEKEELRRDTPSNIINELGLAGILGVAAHKPAQGKSASAAKPVAKKKKNWDWLLWLALILLILMIFLWWRSCDRKKDAEERAAVTEQVVSTPQPVKREAPVLEGVKRTLAGGQVVTFYENATTDYLKAYLDSDKFRNATEAELSTVWFEFPAIDFEHNSATDLMAGAGQKIEKLAALLKGYPKVNIKVGAFADKTGTKATNFAITEKRAANIKAAFEKAGIDGKRISTEGFGEGYAQVAENATDAQRAPDRDIALRFTK